MTEFGKKNGSSQFVKTRPKLKTQFLNLMTTQKAEISVLIVTVNVRTKVKV